MFLGEFGTFDKEACLDAHATELADHHGRAGERRPAGVAHRFLVGVADGAAAVARPALVGEPVDESGSAGEHVVIEFDAGELGRLQRLDEPGGDRHVAGRRLWLIAPAVVCADGGGAEIDGFAGGGGDAFVRCAPVGFAQSDGGDGVLVHVATADEPGGGVLLFEDPLERAPHIGAVLALAHGVATSHECQGSQAGDAEVVLRSLVALFVQVFGRRLFAGG